MEHGTATTYCARCDDCFETTGTFEEGGWPGERLFAPDEELCPPCRREPAAPEATPVFVYGSLRATLGLNTALDITTTRFVAEDSLEGFSMISLGGFPASAECVLPGTLGSIVGEIYEVDRATLARLDSIEGHPRHYERVKRTTRSGREVHVYLYPAERFEQMARGTGGHHRCFLVPDGNWIAHELREVYGHYNEGEEIPAVELAAGLEGQRTLRRARWGDGSDE